MTPREYLEELEKRQDEYDGFNLLVGDLVNSEEEGGIWYLSNKSNKPPTRLQPNKVRNCLLSWLLLLLTIST